MAGLSLVFDEEINGETVRQYHSEEGWDNTTREWGDVFTYIEVTKENGSVIIYSDNEGTDYYNTYWKKLDELVFINGDEVRIFNEYRVTLIRDGEKMRYPEDESPSLGFAKPVMDTAQEQFLGYLDTSRNYGKQVDQDYYDSTLAPLQTWALDQRGEE